jgi:nucleoside-diphosphate-sugar epimerase
VSETEPAPPVLAVTGANGYVGRLVSARYREAGWTVISLQRRVENDGAGSSARRFILGEPIDPDLLAGVDMLIHCAYDMTLTNSDDIERVNIEGTKRLFEAAVVHGVRRMVLVSSMSAYWGTEQVYGRAKLACEDAAAAAGGVSVRLGLVYGDGWGGMARSLRKLVELPVTPLVGARSYQYTVHEDDAAQGLLALGAVKTFPSGAVVGLAHARRVPFRTLLEGFGRQAGVAPKFLPVPWRPVYGAMRVAELLRVPLPLRGDSLLGLVRPAGFVPSGDIWPDLGLTLRPFAL